MKQAWQTAVAYKLVWFRVACYFAIPFATTFLSLTENFTDTDWANMSLFLRIRLFLTAAVAGFMPLIAFIDQSLDNAKIELERRQAIVRQQNQAQVNNSI